MRAFARAASFVAAASSVAACTLLADFDVPVVDSSDARADLAPDPARPVVATFDEPRPACGLTRVQEGTATPDPEARTGSGACRICAVTTGGNIRAEFDVPAPLAGTYILQAWYRQPPGATTPPRWAVRLEARFARSLDAGPKSADQSGTADQTWRPAQATLQVGLEPDRVFAWLGAETNLVAGDCLLLDDVEIAYQP